MFCILKRIDCKINRARSASAARSTSGSGLRNGFRVVLVGPTAALLHSVARATVGTSPVVAALFVFRAPTVVAFLVAFPVAFRVRVDALDALRAGNALFPSSVLPPALFPTVFVATSVFVAASVFVATGPSVASVVAGAWATVGVWVNACVVVGRR